MITIKPSFQKSKRESILLAIQQSLIPKQLPVGTHIGTPEAFERALREFGWELKVVKKKIREEG